MCAGSHQDDRCGFHTGQRTQPSVQDGLGLHWALTFLLCGLCGSSVWARFCLGSLSSGLSACWVRRAARTSRSSLFSLRSTISSMSSANRAFSGGISLGTVGKSPKQTWRDRQDKNTERGCELGYGVRPLLRACTLRPMDLSLKECYSEGKYT